jgi:hypothetical protein
MWDVDGVAIDNCRFRDLGGSSIYLEGCRNTTLDGKPILGNSNIP